MSAAYEVQLAGQGAGIAGAAVGTGASIAAAGGLTLATGLATFGIGAAIAVLIMSFFHGANPNQIPAAQIEQIFEIAADNLYALAQNGIITIQQAIQGMQALITSGQQLEAQYQARIGNPAVRGSQNLTKVINAEIAGAQALPTIPLVANATLAGARAFYYVKAGASGWYAGSITQGTSLTDQLVTQMIAQNETPSDPINAAVSALTGSALGSGSTSPLTHLLLLAALAFAVWKVL
ncbi:MAG: hypothetical protein ACRD4Q_01130 [Candidatus Acidiferrales bacterium]